MKRHQIVPAVVSTVVLILFGGALVVVLDHALPDGNKDAAMLLLGMVSTKAASIVDYWTGSSSGSADKTQMMADKDAQR